MDRKNMLQLVSGMDCSDSVCRSADSSSDFSAERLLVPEAPVHGCDRYLHKPGMGASPLNLPEEKTERRKQIALAERDTFSTQ